MKFFSGLLLVVALTYTHILLAQDHIIWLENDQPISFHADVLPIVQVHCASCHNSRSSTPDFTKLEVAQKWRDKIRVRVFERANMPPGNMTRMSIQEREIIAAWVDLGCHE